MRADERQALLAAVAVGAVVWIGLGISAAKGAKKPFEPDPSKAWFGLGPHEPIIQDAVVVSSGLGKTPGNVTVPWRIEQVEVDPARFVGLVWKPWVPEAGSKAVNVAEGDDKDTAVAGVLAWISVQQQGLPG